MTDTSSPVEMQDASDDGLMSIIKRLHERIAGSEDRVGDLEAQLAAERRMKGPFAIDPSESGLYERIADLEALLTAERRMNGRLQKALDRATPAAETIERMAEAKAKKIVEGASSEGSERIADLEVQLVTERLLNWRLQETIQADCKPAIDELLKRLLEPSPDMIAAGKAVMPVDGEEFAETIWRAMVTELKAVR